MKFLFLPAHCVPFHGNSLAQRPLGGTETSIIRLAEAISNLGHEVIISSDIANPPLTQPLYVPTRSLPFVGAVDILIGIRDWRMCLYPVTAKKRFFWTGDAHDQPLTVGIGDIRVSRSIDKFLAVSQWHADSMCETSGFPLDKTAIIRNGIQLELFSETLQKDPKRLIYSSTPYRGLIHLIEIFKEIQKRHPEASLHIFSGYDVYQGGRDSMTSLQKEFDTIKEQLVTIPNVTTYGNIMQGDLAKEFLRSSILAYPNTFAETSCITAMEAQAAGCVPVTSALGALPETIGDAGILIQGKPGGAEYIKAYIEAVDGLLSNPERLKIFSDRCLARAPQFGWEHVAKKVIDLSAMPR